MSTRDAVVQCEGKQPFASWSLANEGRRRMAGRFRGRRARRMSVYRCPHCGAFHVGHDLKRRRLLPHRGRAA